MRKTAREGLRVALDARICSGNVDIVAIASVDNVLSKGSNGAPSDVRLKGKTSGSKKRLTPTVPGKTGKGVSERIGVNEEQDDQATRSEEMEQGKDSVAITGKESRREVKWRCEAERYRNHVFVFLRTRKPRKKSKVRKKKQTVQCCDENYMLGDASSLWTFSVTT